MRIRRAWRAAPSHGRMTSSALHPASRRWSRCRGAWAKTSASTASPTSTCGPTVIRTMPAPSTSYQAAALETDLPAIERATYQRCDVFDGDRCTHLPMTDDGSSADFYPFYSIGTLRDGKPACFWTLGESIPGFTQNAF